LIDPLTIPSTRLATERAVAIEAVRAASLLCRSVRAELGPTFTHRKADRSPVTVADLGAQALITLVLADALPADPLMAEEDSAPLRASDVIAAAVLRQVGVWRPSLTAIDLTEALDASSDPGGPGRRWWTCDPVDGTKGFLRDEQYAVALALVEDGEVVLGVLGCPNLPPSLHDPPRGLHPPGLLFVAERDGGAWQLPLVEDGTTDSPAQISVDPTADPALARYAESVEAGHSSQSGAARLAADLGIAHPPLRLDSQAKYAVVARGEAGIYARLPHGDYRENVWDHAAGSIIVREAGGVVTDIRGRPLDFTAGRRLEHNVGIVAASPAFHGAAIAALAAQRG
jgi:3'(2'), 5'-bisphosphate nucleotidase